GVWPAWFGAACLLVSRPASRRWLAPAIVAAAVFSHFVLDVLVHTPDLPLGPGPGSPKIGLGLWHHRTATTVAELAVLFAGALIYLRATRPATRAATLSTTIYVVILIAATVATPLLPDPSTPPPFAVQALACYAILAAAAEYVDRRRAPRN